MQKAEMVQQNPGNRHRDRRRHTAEVATTRMVRLVVCHQGWCGFIGAPSDREHTFHDLTPPTVPEEGRQLVRSINVATG